MVEPQEDTHDSPRRDGEGTGGRPCVICGAPMYKRHCKYICEVHGVIYDCSDTFW